MESITVPFAPGAAASGILWESPSSVVWYQRSFDRPKWSHPGLLLNIGASDYISDIYINGHHVCSHRGGYTAIQCAIEDWVEERGNVLTIRVADTDSWQQPRGKQAGDTRWPIDYDAVIGIWQSVWLEPVTDHYFTSIFSRYDDAGKTLSVSLTVSEQSHGRLIVKLSREGVVVESAQANFANRDEATVRLVLADPQLWSPDDPNLYDLDVTLIDEPGKTIDQIASYAGLREVRWQDGGLLLNGERQYLRGVLDQGYFPDGWYTAVDDEALRRDVALTKAMGFNFARKHQKIEDPRYLYWADKLGLMLWAEMPAGRIFSTQLIQALVEQWPRALIRDRSHPSIVGWVVFNESWGIWHQGERPEQRHLADALYSLTKSIDPTRPTIGNDGWEFSTGDVWAVHSYEQGHGALAKCIDRLLESPQSYVADVGRPRQGALEGADPRKLPLVLSECGGVGFVGSNRSAAAEHDDFAYGEMPENEDNYASACRGLLAEISEIHQLSGFVWTQLTDVQQEVNGLLFFDREPKLPIEHIRQMVLSVRD